MGASTPPFLNQENLKLLTCAGVSTIQDLPANLGFAACGAIFGVS